MMKSIPKFKVYTFRARRPGSIYSHVIASEMIAKRDFVPESREAAAHILRNYRGRKVEIRRYPGMNVYRVTQYAA